MMRMLESWVASWVTDRVAPGREGRRSIRRIAEQSLRRRANSYKPRNYVRRKVRGAVRRTLPW